MTRLEVRRCSLEDQQVDLEGIKEEKPCRDISRTGQPGWEVSRTRINKSLTGGCLIKLADIVLVIGLASSDLYIYYLEVRA